MKLIATRNLNLKRYLLKKIFNRLVRLSGLTLKIMKWNKLYKYPPSTRSLVEGNRHYDINQEMLPSVTTIIQETQSDEKKASLANWRQKVGENEAEKIRDEAAARGTAMHKFLEYYVQNQKLLDLSDEGQAAWDGLLSTRASVS